MSFLLPFLLFPITQDFFLPNFLARIHSRKSYLTFVCGYKRVFGSLRAGRSTHYPTIIETPGPNTERKKGTRHTDNLYNLETREVRGGKQPRNYAQRKNGAKHKGSTHTWTPEDC